MLRDHGKSLSRLGNTETKYNSRNQDKALEAYSYGILNGISNESKYSESKK